MPIRFQETEAHKRTLKRVSDTTRSWRSAEDGVPTLIECFETISKTMECLENDRYNDTSKAVLELSKNSRGGQLRT